MQQVWRLHIHDFMDEETQDKMAVSAPTQMWHWFRAQGTSLTGGPLKYTTPFPTHSPASAGLALPGSP